MPILNYSLFIFLTPGSHFPKVLEGKLPPKLVYFVLRKELPKLLCNGTLALIPTVSQ